MTDARALIPQTAYLSEEAIGAANLLILAQKERIALLEKQLEHERREWQTALQQQLDQLASIRLQQRGGK